MTGHVAEQKAQHTAIPERVVALADAAPDMADALEAVIGLIERMPNANAILEAENGARIVGQARAAMAKARGDA